MTRKTHGRITTAIALLLAAVAAILLAFATTAGATGTTTPTPVPNPDLPPACGTRVILVLDESGSIANTAGAESAVRTAANAFASGLADTGSQLAVIEFGSRAKRVVGYTPVTSGAGGTIATTFQPYFNGTAAGDRYDSPSQLGQWTNWQDALEEVKLLNAESGVAPLVVFVTDGDPTAINTSGGVQTGVANATALVPAITEANAVKTQGSHILAVGVGAALGNAGSLSRLVAVSGPDVASTTADLDIATTDVLRVNDFSTLPDALRALVNQLCQGSVTVNKLVDEGQGWVPGGAGWQFDATVSTAAGTYSWLTPDPGPAGPRSAATGADSAATFQWKPSVNTTSTVTIAEVERPGYLLSNVYCQVKTLANPTPAPLAIQRDGTAFTATLGPTDIVTCTVKNSKMHPAVAIDKSVSPSVVLAGTQVTYTITVTNTGDVPLSDVAVADPLAPSCAATVGALGVGAVHQYTCTATINEDTLNVATVTAKDPQGTPLAPKNDDAWVDVIAPAVAITKSVDKPVVTSGTQVTWSVDVHNTGDVTLYDVAVTDPQAPECATVIGTLAAGAHAPLITCTATITQAVTNVATVTATDQLGNPLSANDDAAVQVIAPGLSVVKDVDRAVVLAGTQVTWTVTVTNTGDVPLTNVVVDDDIAPGCDAVIASLDAGATAAPITCTSTIMQDTVNTVTATATDPLEQPVGPASDTAAVDVIAPAIAVTKAADKPSIPSGGTVTFTITVTNTGDAPLANVAVTDPLTPACDRVIGEMAAGGVSTYTCTTTLTQSIVNVAVAAGTDPLGNPVTAQASAPVEVTPVITGDPQTTLSIDKRGPARAKSGAVIAYTVRITNTGAVVAKSVVMRDRIPTSMTLVGRTPGVGVSKGHVVISVGDLAPGASKTLRLRFRIDLKASGLRTNVATASAANARSVRDTARTRIARIAARVIVPRVTG
jgi:uncharacterized repeat protein (TIGR01451 family)